MVAVLEIMTMKLGKTLLGAETVAPGAASGITLLEAYSALAKRNGGTAAVEIPFPGCPNGVDSEGEFWQIRVQSIG